MCIVALLKLLVPRIPSIAKITKDSQRAHTGFYLSIINDLAMSLTLLTLLLDNKATLEIKVLWLIMFLKLKKRIVL